MKFRSNSVLLLYSFIKKWPQYSSFTQFLICKNIFYIYIIKPFEKETIL